MPVGRPAGMNVGLVAALARLVVLTRFNDVFKRLAHGGVGIAVGGAVAQRGRTCSMVCPRPGMGWSWHNHGREDSVKLTRLSLTSPRTGENTLMDNVR